MLKGSPGPMPGAPLKSPMVSLTTPLLPTDPAPVARLMRLMMLYISARSCTRKRSLTVKFLKTDRSTSAKPGPDQRVPAEVARGIGSARTPCGAGDTEGGWVNPLLAADREIEASVHAGVRIANYIQARALRAGGVRPWEIEGLAAMQ